MIRRGAWIACALVLATNAILLAGVAYNRAGTPTAAIELTERELPPVRSGDEDTGLALRIATAHPPWEYEILDRAALAELGFDCTAPPNAEEAEFHYGKQLPRRGFLALEYDGEAWERWIAERRRRAEEQAREADRGTRSPYATDPLRAFEETRLSHSRLVPVDAGPDPETLRRRQTDPDRIVILPAVFRIRVERPWDPDTGAPRPPRIRGDLDEILVSSVHVPPEKADPILGLPRTFVPRRNADPFEEPQAFEPRYRVHLNVGRRHEPWIESIVLAD